MHKNEPGDVYKMAQNGTLKPKQLAFMTALLAGSDVQNAAACANVPRRTAYNWLDNPVFQAHYEKERKQLLSRSLASLHTKFGKAIETIDRHLAADSGAAPRDQLKSAEIVIRTTIQTAQLLERIAALETAMAQREQEELYIVKFDLHALTPDERELLWRVNTAVAARKT